MSTVTFKVFRGDRNGGELKDYTVEVEEGMVVLDAIHQIQAEQAPDLACRWNCKAGKCGSCGAEVNGKPTLMCMTRLDTIDTSKPVTIRPMKTFPVIRDLATDVKWNYEANKKIKPFTPAPGTDWIMFQEDVDRVQEFRKCIECFLCQNVCHVLREHDEKTGFIGPRLLVRTASLEMHPLDVENRLDMLQNEGGIGYCNITKCCTEVCPEHIHITDNAIIPLKERVVDEYYDPILGFFRRLFGSKKQAQSTGAADD
ncbi:succinate dehydrogenase/fumarate reductase iron-sulfur subunit [Meiothermus cerbereus]|uniref:succinate dehydrogenase/fumarate reductase iron-sulfur subunit n=1 Tax=Meiothermus cerbereus TaxID=65552 RepID=UPI003EE83FA8